MPRRHIPRTPTRRARDDGHPSGGGEHLRRDGTPKTAYMSRGEALSVAEEWSHENGLRLEAYVCTVCGAWHLGNPLEGDD